MPPLARKSNTLLKIFCLLVVAAVNYVCGVCDSDEFKIIDECVCPGYTTAVYKCTVVGNGFTQWAGSAFNCPNIGDEIFLSHPDFNDGIRKECNNGAIIGQSLQVNGSCFISQLTVNISTNLNGTTIGCTYDTGSALEPIGATTLTSITDSLSPPENVHLLDVSPEVLVFSWTPVPLNCSALRYEIQSSCGECPTFTNSTSVTCIIQKPLDRMCGFAVRSVVCNNMVGGWSNEIEIMLRVPNPPMFSKISSRYDPRNLLGLDIQFSHLSKDSFNISSGIDGSTVYYTVTFNNSITGEMCASTIISPSSCSDVCATSLPLSCFPLSGDVVVSVSATNVLGKGPTNSVIIGNTNEYVLVTAESSGRITCTFLNQQDIQMEKSCSVLYGRCAEQLSYSSAFHARNDSITVQLHNVRESDLQGYCYATIANNGTFSVLIEGSFSSLNNDIKSCSTLVSVLSVALLLVGVVMLFCVAYFLYTSIQRRKSNHNHNDFIHDGADLTELPKLTRQSSCQVSQVPSQPSQHHEVFRAHVVFDLEHLPWKLLSALKIFKDMNMVDIRIIPVDKKTRKIYIQFEQDLSMTEVENVYKNCRRMTQSIKAFQVAEEEFMDIYDESETNDSAVYRYRRQFPPKSGSLYKFLEGVNELSQKNSHYDLINIWRIVVQPSSHNDGDAVIELQFVRELPSNWVEEFDKIQF